MLRAAAAYLAVSWILMQLAEITFPAFGLNDRAILVLIAVLAIGFIPAVTLAWVFEITPEGIKREEDLDREGELVRRTNRLLDRSIIVLLTLGVTYLAIDKFLVDPARDEAEIAAAQQRGRTEALREAFGDKSIVVLPFANLSGDPEQEYFSDGMSEQLLDLLTRIPELRVISRASAFSFKDRKMAMQEIADQLSVSHALTGSVRWAGDTVRVTAQLVDAHSDSQIWSQTYDRPIDDIFAIQDEIAANVVQKLKVSLLDQTRSDQRIEPAAFALYLQARKLSREGTADAYQQSNELYGQALAIDDGYAAAWSGLAINYFKQFSRGLEYFDNGYGAARDAAQRALAIDPEYAPALATLAMVENEATNDLAAAARYFEKALKLAPRDLEIIRHVVVFLQGLGRLEEAVALGEYAIERHPVNATTHGNLGNSYRWSRRYEEAIGSYQAALRLSPGLGAAHSFIGISHLSLGNHDEALKFMMDEPFEPYRLLGLAMAHYSLGNQQESDAALLEMITRHEREWAYNIAYVHAWREETDKAFEWLRKAADYADPGLTLILAEPLFDGIRNDPRWMSFLEERGKAPEQLSMITFTIDPPD